MTHLFTARRDVATTTVAIICLMGPLLLGVARTLGVGV